LPASPISRRPPSLGFGTVGFDIAFGLGIGVASATFDIRLIALSRSPASITFDIGVSSVTFHICDIDGGTKLGLNASSVSARGVQSVNDARDIKLHNHQMHPKFVRASSGLAKRSGMQL
jgi:hypothetical protein